MPTYTVYYATGDYGKAWFDADDIDHAHKLIAEVEQGEMSFDELPNLLTKVQGDEFSAHSLMEVS